MLEYGNVGMMGETEYRLWEGHASACLGRADARPSPGCFLPIFQYSAIPLFLLKVARPFIPARRAGRLPAEPVQPYPEAMVTFGFVDRFFIGLLGLLQRIGGLG